MADNSKKQGTDFFQRLTKVFRSNPSIHRRVRKQNYDEFYGNKANSNSLGYKAPPAQSFGKEASPYSTMVEANILDRMARYMEFQQMEFTPEIAAALDVVADETVGGDDRGRAFHIYSTNPQIKQTLDELFYEIVNVEFNLRPWIRNLVKFGDFFLYHEVVPDFGVVNVAPIPVSELEREESFDPDDPYAVRFKRIAGGTRYLENWQVTHMRLLGNDLFLPYGSSMLEPARRIWRMLCMLEDAMLVYRVVRAPDRRVFYIDVSAVDPNDVASYMEAAKATLRATTRTDQNGNQDQRYNPLDLVEDFFIPSRGGETGTKIDTLSGATNTTATEDVTYIQNKLFAALKVPKAYLNYDESTGAKATLAQEDVRFSRTIGIYQKIIIAEMTKLAMIHLFAKGFDGEDLVNFELKLSNPSTIALQQRIEIWKTKTDVAGSMKETELFDNEWIQRNILELTSEDIAAIEEGRRRDQIRVVELEALEAQEKVKAQMETLDTFNPSGYQMTGGDVEKTPAGEPSPEDTLASVMLTPDETAEQILSRVKSYDVDGNPYFINYDDKDAPLKASPYASREKHNSRRRVGTTGRDNLANPDFNMMVSAKSRSLKDLYDKKFLDDPFGEALEREISSISSSRSKLRLERGEFGSVLRRMTNSQKFTEFKQKKKNDESMSKMLTESLETEDDEVDLSFISEDSVAVEDDSIDLILESFQPVAPMILPKKS